MDSDYRLKLSQAISRILSPLTRLCIRQEVNYGDLTKLTRTSFVETAVEHFRLPGPDQMTNSRISVLTGMSRKVVKNVRQSRESESEFTATGQNRAQQVVHGWLKDPEFLDENNKPLVLPIKSIYGDKEVGSFVSLVKRYSGDISHGAILDQLNHALIIELPDENTVSPNQKHLYPSERRFGTNSRYGKKCFGFI